MKLQEKIDKTIDYMEVTFYDTGRIWYSPTEIGYVINGGHSSVGSPVCKKMVERGILERNEKGHYRLL